MKNRSLLIIFGIAVVSLAVLLPQWYLALNPQLNLDWTDFAAAVVLPILLAVIFFGITKQRILLFGFLAFIWSAADDAPVYLDSVFTWPEVTSGFQHTFLEVLLHLLTIVFLIFTVREALKETRVTWQKITIVSILSALSFLFAYAQNVPFTLFQNAAANSWYQFDIFEHLLSLGFLALAVLVAKRSKLTSEVKIISRN